MRVIFVKEIKLKTEYITLQQLLKMEDFISSGGEAKYYLMDNYALVNGEKENRRGRKLYPNDCVIIENKEFKLL
jgi:S4 domain protein YaaA